eukprot:6193934-Pleurochrysis_carterae.AAC.1
MRASRWASNETSEADRCCVFAQSACVDDFGLHAVRTNASSVVVDVEETFSTEQGVKTQQQAEASAASLALSSLEPAEKFDLILASDVIYSSCHARRLPAVVGKRMSAGGRMAAMVPVRSESNSREFFDGLVAAGMHVRYALVDTDWCALT